MCVINIIPQITYDGIGISFTHKTSPRESVRLSLVTLTLDVILKDMDPRNLEFVIRYHGQRELGGNI